MGQTLSTPATHKTTDSGGDDRFLYSVSEMQGWRISMEDAHAVVLDLDGREGDGNVFVAVYDGHGGGTVARYAGENVHKRLITEEAYHKKEYEAALKQAFLGIDRDVLADPSHAREPSGCTAVAALITNDQRIYVANAGDSRSVLSVKGEVKPLSFDHKPSNEIERNRIIAAGGYVEYGRVNGNLALSRALGDFDFKKNLAMIPEAQIITADPDVTVHEVTDEDEFLVLACDGIWDCLTSQQVVDFVRLYISQGKELAEIGELLFDHCLAPDTSSNIGIGCDNMTVLIVALLHGRTKEEWYAWITDRVQRGYGYETPSTVPQLYAMSRLLSFRARLEAQKARERARMEQQQQRQQQQQQQQQQYEDDDDDDDAGSGKTGGFLTSSGFYARITGSTGGISYHPGSQIMSDSGQLMFVNTSDSDDEDDYSHDDDDDIHHNGDGRSRNEFGSVFGLGHIGDVSFARDAALGLGSLKACLEELDHEDHELGDDGGGSREDRGWGGNLNNYTDADGDAHMEELDGPVDHDDNGVEGDDADNSPDAHEEDGVVKPLVNGVRSNTLRSSSKSLPNGEAKTTQQQTEGEKPSQTTKVEGLLDASENPFRA